MEKIIIIRKQTRTPNLHAFQGFQFTLGDLIEPIILEGADERVLGDSFM